MSDLPARIRARWECIKHGHLWVNEGTGNAMEAWGHCDRCRATYYDEPIPEVR